MPVFGLVSSAQFNTNRFFFGVPYLVIFLVQKNKLATLTTEEQANLVVNAKVVNPDGTS